MVTPSMERKATWNTVSTIAQTWSSLICAKSLLKWELIPTAWLLMRRPISCNEVMGRASPPTKPPLQLSLMPLPATLVLRLRPIITLHLLTQSNLQSQILPKSEPLQLNLLQLTQRIFHQKAYWKSLVKSGLTKWKESNLSASTGTNDARNRAVNVLCSRVTQKSKETISFSFMEMR